MTTKDLKYERFECDICHKVEKKERVVDNNNNIWPDGITYTITLGGESVKPDPIKIEMCEECDLSFKSWRLKREHQ